VIPWPLNRIDELLARPDFTESRSISALLLASKWLAEQEISPQRAFGNQTEDGTMQELLAWIPEVKEIAREAGRILHEIYHGGQFERQLKEDATGHQCRSCCRCLPQTGAVGAHSPCARADRRGGRHPLQPACQLAPVLAGGSLDGTGEFIAGSGDFAT
jgi:hypothetical protein